MNTEMNTENVVIAENLYKRFIAKPSKKKINALTNINIKIPAGKLTALIGPDGAGKSTFMRLICGLMTPSEGNLTVLGINTKDNPQEIQNRISYMSQRFGLYEDLSIQENLDLYADLHGVSKKERRERFDELLKMTGLEAFTKRQAGKLSGGMKQKLSLACTLVRSPELLLLDEPTVGVDPLSRRELWEILQKLVQKEKLTVLVSTAYMDEAELCQRIGFISQGKLVALDTPANLKETQMRGDVLEITVDQPDKAMRLLKAAQANATLPLDEVALYGAQVHAVVPNSAQYKPIIQSLLSEQGLVVRGIEWVAPSLEDVFISSVNAPKT